MGLQKTFSAGPQTDGLAQDFSVLVAAANNLSLHAAEMLTASVTTDLLLWLAAVAAVYLLVLDRTNWRTNFLTALLVPYLYINLPDLIFAWLYGTIGKVIASVAVVVKLFFPRHFPDVLELPASLILLVVVSPSFLAFGTTVGRNSLLAIVVSLGIGAFLLYEHINAAGGWRKAFAEKKGIPVSAGILVLFLAPFCQIFSFLNFF